MSSSLTGNDEASLGGRQSCFSGESMLGAALIGLVSVFGSNIANVKLSRRQYQVFSICSGDRGGEENHTDYSSALIRPVQLSNQG